MRKNVAVLVGFCLLAAVWFYKEAFLNYLFCYADLTYYFYPYRYFMAESLRHGVLPLWNPFIHMGFPFLATLQTGIFYPFSVLYFLPPVQYRF